MLGNNEDEPIYEHTIYLSLKDSQPLGRNEIAQFKFPLPNSLNLNSDIADYFIGLSYFELTDKYVLVPLHFHGEFGELVDDVFVSSGPTMDFTVYSNGMDSLLRKLNTLLTPFNCSVKSSKKKGMGKP